MVVVCGKEKASETRRLLSSLLGLRVVVLVQQGASGLFGSLDVEAPVQHWFFSGCGSRGPNCAERPRPLSQDERLEQVSDKMELDRRPGVT